MRVGHANCSAAELRWCEACKRFCVSVQFRLLTQEHTCGRIGFSRYVQSSAGVNCLAWSHTGTRHAGKARRSVLFMLLAGRFLVSRNRGMGQRTCMQERWLVKPAGCHQLSYFMHVTPARTDQVCSLVHSRFSRPPTSCWRG